MTWLKPYRKNLDINKICNNNSFIKFYGLIDLYFFKVEFTK